MVRSGMRRKGSAADALYDTLAPHTADAARSFSEYVSRNVRIGRSPAALLIRQRVPIV